MWETILSVLLTGVGVIIVGLVVKLWPAIKALLPNWATNIMVTMADVFVRWAESEYGEGGGTAKFMAVLEKLTAYLADKGISIEEEVIRAAIEAAWQKMNAEQVTAGLKEVQ